jgi:hypothetical protein
MSYVELKLIKGRLYGYLRQSIRIGKRVIHKNIAYLGAVSPIYKSAIEPITITPREERKIKIPDIKIKIGIQEEFVKEEAIKKKKKKKRKLKRQIDRTIK